jgi:hypothetical protein
MELDITDFFTNAAPMDYSASVAEIGCNAGPDTWRAACEDSADFPLLQTDEQRAEFRRYVKGFGAWEDEEINAWTDTELNALCIQMIAGDMREAGLSSDCTDEDWMEYQRKAERGTVTSSIYRDEDGSHVWYYVGD